MTRLIRRWITKGKLLTVVTGLMMSALLIIAACGGTSEATTPEATPASNQPVGISVSARWKRVGNEHIDPRSGISVSARGEVVTTPDLVVINAGVESRADTVEIARTQAAQGIDRMVQVLSVRGVGNADIQTSFFSISPDYVWDDMREEQELVGYVVNNRVLVKIRDGEQRGRHHR